MDWLKTAQTYLEQGDYSSAATELEEAVEAEPTVIEHHLFLGLTYLLLGQEEEAQATWLCSMAEVETSAIPKWTDYLLLLLEKEAQRQAQQQQYQTCWLLRQHIRELAPKEIHNLLKLLLLELQLKQFSPQVLTEWELIPTLKQSNHEQISQFLLLQILEGILLFLDGQILDFVRVCLDITESPQILVDTLLKSVERLTIENTYQHYEFAIEVLNIILEFSPPNLQILGMLWTYYRKIFSVSNAINTAQKYFNICESLQEKLVGSYMLFDAYLQGGRWLEIQPFADQYHQFLREVLNLDPKNIDLISVKYLLLNISLYLEDDLVKNSTLRNQAALAFSRRINQSFCCSKISNSNSQLLVNQRNEKKLKIGFYSHTLRNHSVGWLSRWLFRELDREKFWVAIYLQDMKQSNVFFQEWFYPHANVVRNCPDYIEQAADMIASDQVDILIDLDASTHATANCVLALKPAPIQATWLGWDATGLPSIDYFIADPYVLPANAQDYYREKILRLPHTYIAVGGFEVDVPNLKRSDLNISTDSIIYLSNQRAIKQHPDAIRAQLEIIKHVPNSYLLIKAGADISVNQDYFVSMADLVGISLDRIRFLGQAEMESIHRANLRIADVILDTFPYNGATTTLEALWMGIPLVTKVGEQFTARYSYAFLKNVGIEEGIAYSNEEYIEWGIQLGTNEKLRQKVVWKLRQSRHTSTLWNAKGFTQDMENAFLQMWHNYVEDIRFRKAE